MKRLYITLLITIVFLGFYSNANAERMLVKPDAEIAEKVVVPPEDLNKAALRAELNTHETLTLAEIIHILGTNGFKGTEAQAKIVAEKLIELGDFVTYNARYNELYSSEEIEP